MPRARVARATVAREFEDGVALDCDVEYDRGEVGNFSLPKTGYPIEIRFYDDGVFRFEFHGAPEVRAAHETLPLAEDELGGPSELRIVNDGDTLRLETAELRVHVGLTEWSFHVETVDGRSLLSEQREDDAAKDGARSSPLGFIVEETNRWPLRTTGAGAAFKLRGDERIFGLGEKFTEFEKRGQRVESWVTQPHGAETPHSYKNVPFFLSSRGYGFLADTYRKVDFEVGSDSTVSNEVTVDDDNFQFVFFHGPSFKEILDDYTALTGRPGHVPRWSLGVWMSRLAYETREELEGVTEQLRETGMPCDVVHLDPTWLDGDRLCDLVWDRDAFPDPEGMIDDLHADGFKLSLWENPYVLTITEAYEEARENGYLVRDSGGKPYLLSRLSWSPVRGGIVDFSNPEAVKWWQDRHAHLLEMGVDVFKTDFGEYLPEDAVCFDGTSGRVSRNRQAHRYTEAVHEAMAEARPDRRPLLWARPGWAGGQQFPVHWGGDPNTTFEAMAASLRGGLSLALSGYAFWGADIGGFHGEPSTELYVRWAQFGLLGNSHARFHGTTPREPWHFGDRALEIVREYARERYRLLPYLFSYAERAPETGLPVMRPLVLEFQDDRGVYGIGDQFLVGENLLLAPVFDADGHVEVYLPRGKWVDYWTGDSYEGGQTLSLDVDLEEMPVFLRAGTITPTTEPTESVSEEPFESVELRVLLDDGATDATFEYVDGDVAGTIRATADAAHDTVEFAFDAASGCSLSPERFTATVEGIDGVPETVAVASSDADGDQGEFEPLERVDAQPAAGEWTVDDDGTVSVGF
jgi:alpha-D-xyloside xylohydrolase